MGRVRDGICAVQPELESYLVDLRRLIQVEAAVVFGSRARNDHWESSDIDLLIVSPDFADWPNSRRTDLLLSCWPGRPALEPFGVTAQELEGYGHLLLWDALDQGRPLFDSGAFGRGQSLLRERMSRQDLVRTPGGWREKLG